MVENAPPAPTLDHCSELVLVPASRDWRMVAAGWDEGLHRLLELECSRAPNYSTQKC